MKTNPNETDKELKLCGYYVTIVEAKEEMNYFELPLSESTPTLLLDQVILCKQVGGFLFVQYKIQGKLKGESSIVERFGRSLVQADLEVKLRGEITW